jgi:hypothetical protein
MGPLDRILGRVHLWSLRAGGQLRGGGGGRPGARRNAEDHPPPGRLPPRRRQGPGPPRDSEQARADSPTTSSTS